MEDCNFSFILVEFIDFEVIMKYLNGFLFICFFYVLFQQLLNSGNFNSKQDACIETDDIFDGTNGANASCICNVSVNIVSFFLSNFTVE